jgi:hypothetical protein
MLYATAKLAIADHLADGAKTAEQLAGPTQTHAPSLYRLMRTLASLGILSEDKSHAFTLTALGQALRTGAPGAARSTILLMASDWWFRGWNELIYSLQTGKPGFEKSLGMPVFDYLAQHPADASLFSEAMVGIHGEEPKAIAAAYDFSPFKTIVDVGGATGHLLTTIIAKTPGAKGILYDLPHVVREAPPMIESRGVKDRVTIAPGSFFDSVPPGGDAYILSHIIHDWTEEQCLKILGNVRKQLKPDGRVLLIEMVLPEGNTPHPGKVLDIMMLVGPGGQERTPAEYNALFAKAGLKLIRIVPTASPVSVVEAGLA